MKSFGGIFKSSYLPMILVLSCFSGSSYATEETDLETAESQASFGYGYGTKASNSYPAIFLIFYK